MTATTTTAFTRLTAGHPVKRTNTFERRSLQRFVTTIFIALCAYSTGAAAQNGVQTQAGKPAGYGAHGMAVFGGLDGLYASHLPMFHAPHDAQVVFRFHLNDAAADAALRHQLAAKPELWTLDPQAFDLHRLAPGHAQPLTEFAARFVQGHFERGGQERYPQQTVTVDQVLLFKRLADVAHIHSAGRYHVVGAGREFFAVKTIDRRPDFDVIVAMQPMPKSVALPTTLQYVSLPTDNLQAPRPAALQQALHAQGATMLRVGPTLYFETEDLK